MSRDIDLFAYDVANVEGVSDQLDGALGQASPFDQTFGYYCDGVGPETAIFPVDWELRAIEFTTPSTEGVVAVVPEPNDIALAKMCAWRPKDIAWLRAAVAHLVVDPAIMEERLPLMPSRAGDTALLADRISQLSNPG